MEAVCEDAFFRSADEIVMLAPDGKKMTIPVEKMRELVNQLPEMPAEKRLLREQMQAQMKKKREQEKQRQGNVLQADTLGLKNKEQ